MQHAGMTMTSYFILQRKHRLRKGPLGLAQGPESLILHSHLCPIPLSHISSQKYEAGLLIPRFPLGGYYMVMGGFCAGGGKYRRLSPGNTITQSLLENQFIENEHSSMTGSPSPPTITWKLCSLHPPASHLPLPLPSTYTSIKYFSNMDLKPIITWSQWLSHSIKKIPLLKLS